MICHSDIGHYPHFENVDSIRGLLYLLVVVELHNVLCRSSYQCPDPRRYPRVPASQLLPTLDINGLTESQRQLRIYTRGVALDLLKYVSCNYRIIDTHTSEVKHMWRDIYLPMLAWTIFALRKSFPSSPSPTVIASANAPTLAYSIFIQQVQWSLNAFTELKVVFGAVEKEDTAASQLSWPGWDQIHALDIKRNPAPFPHTGVL